MAEPSLLPEYRGPFSNAALARHQSVDYRRAVMRRAHQEVSRYILERTGGILPEGLTYRIIEQTGPLLGTLTVELVVEFDTALLQSTCPEFCGTDRVQVRYPFTQDFLTLDHARAWAGAVPRPPLEEYPAHFPAAPEPEPEPEEPNDSDLL